MHRDWHSASPEHGGGGGGGAYGDDYGSAVSPMTRHRLVPSERPRRVRVQRGGGGGGGAVMDATQTELAKLRERIHALEVCYLLNHQGSRTA